MMIADGLWTDRGLSADWGDGDGSDMTDPVVTGWGSLVQGGLCRGPVPFEWASSLSLSSAKRCDSPSLWTVPVAAALLEPLLRTSSLGSYPNATGPQILQQTPIHHHFIEHRVDQHPFVKDTEAGIRQIALEQDAKSVAV
jgi:hypothetical protein